MNDNNGRVPKKLTTAGIGLAMLVSMKDAQPHILSYCIVGGIVIITMAAVLIQGWLDNKTEATPQQ